MKFANGNVSPGRFVEVDVEGPAIADLGKFDLIATITLLYHRQNPFRAARNLADMTNSLLVVESIYSSWAGQPGLVT
jgi:hypothetical protein